MADNINVTPGAGKTVAADEIGGVLHQRVKLGLGADGVAVDVAAGQTTMALSLPVVLPSNQSSIPVAATLTAETTKVIGTIKGDGISVKLAITTVNGVTSIGDTVGGMLTIANAASGNGNQAIINSIKLAGVVAIAYNLWLFDAALSAAFADGAAFAITVADENKCIGVIPIAAADYQAAQSAFNVATVRGIGLQYQAGAATTSIYAYLIATAVTSPGTTDLQLTADIEYLS